MRDQAHAIVERLLDALDASDPSIPWVVELQGGGVTVAVRVDGNELGEIARVSHRLAGDDTAAAVRVLTEQARARRCELPAALCE